VVKYFFNKWSSNPEIFTTKRIYELYFISKITKILALAQLSVYISYINQLYSRRVTTGYTPTAYNPNGKVTREEMAVERIPCCRKSF
jgi:hypothetical protein